MAARKGLHALLNPAGLPIRQNMLRNKSLFAGHAAEHGLAAPQTLTSEGCDLMSWLEHQRSIILKPSYSSKGRNVRAFHQQGNRWLHAGEAIAPQELAGDIARVLARQGVVQELVATHPELASISPGALPTLRIVTCRDEADRPEVCARILRLGSGGLEPVDNFNARGLAVSIKDDGSCGAAFQADAAGVVARVARHPASEEPIGGRVVPDLETACALAALAHQTLPRGFTVVGWDIGLSARGPLIVEGNWNPGTNILQMVEGAGISDTRLGELYRHHLACLPSERWREARAISR